jgi:hypothetical protein
MEISFYVFLVLQNFYICKTRWTKLEYFNNTQVKESCVFLSKKMSVCMEKGTAAAAECDISQSEIHHRFIIKPINLFQEDFPNQI